MHCSSSSDSHSRFAEIDRFDADPVSIHRARERAELADHLHGELQHEFFNRTEAEPWISSRENEGKRLPSVRTK